MIIGQWMCIFELISTEKIFKKMATVEKRKELECLVKKRCSIFCFANFLLKSIINYF